MAKIFKVIATAGSPYEIGHRHGREAAEEIAASLATYREMFRSYAGLSWEEALQKAETYLAPVEKYDPEIMQEIRGIADGSGHPLPWIMALNARSELALTEKMLSGCTSFAVLPETTATGTTFTGQNWDWKSSQRQATVILAIKQLNKPAIMMVTEAGIVGKIGFNSAGLSVCLNALVTAQNVPGIPLHVVLRGILNSENPGDAIRAICRAQIASAANFLIAHRDGEAIDVEAAPADFDFIHPHKGLLAHTNHFTSLRLAGIKDLGKRAFTDSPIRLARVERLLRAERGRLDPEALKGILRDHFNHPDAICRHENPREDQGRRLETVFSLIMDLARREMHLTDGPPCEAEYQVIRAEF